MIGDYEIRAFLRRHLLEHKCNKPIVISIQRKGDVAVTAECPVCGLATGISIYPEWLNRRQMLDMLRVNIIDPWNGVTKEEV